MIKKRKLLSILTALSITATAFAGMVIPANAADITKSDTASATYDFESSEIPFTNGGSAQYTVSLEDDTALSSKVLQATVSGTGGRSSLLTLSSSIDGTDKILNVEFDWYSSTSLGSTDAILIDSSSNQIFKISDVLDNTSKISVNGTEVTAPSATWYKVSADLDFETHEVLNLTITANGETTATATYSHLAFLSESASNVGGFSVVGNRKSGGTMVSTLKMDNFTVYEITDGYYAATINVASNTQDPVSDAEVTIDGKTYTTDSNGQVIVKLTDGSYDYTVHKAGYEATAEQEDDATGTVVVNGDAVEENVTYSPQVYTPVPGTVTLSGGQLAMTAPHSLDSTTSTAYTVEVIDQKGVEIEDADIVWSILPTGSDTADDSVSINDGVITVLSGFDAGDTNVESFTVTATATKNDESLSATATIDISDYLFYEPGVNASSYGSTNTAYNTTGGATGTETYIATPDEKGRTDTITLPDPITFTAGTAQLLSFKTTVQNTVGYSWQRTVSVVDGDGTSIVAFGYINLDIGDSSTASWSSGTSEFTTTWGSIPALTEWVDVTVLFKTNAYGETKVILTVAGNEYELGTTTATGVSAITLYEGLNNVDRYALLKDIVISEVDVTGVEIDGPEEFSTVDGATVTKEYEVDAMVIEDNETFTWSTDIAGATITPSEDTMSATLTVPDTVTEGGTITLVSSVSTDDSPKTATLDVTIEPAEVVSAEVSGSATLDKTAGSAEYTVSNVTDQFGDDITDYVTAVWSLASETETESGAAFEVDAEDAGAAVAIKAVYNEDGTLKSVSTEDVTLVEGTNTITADAGTTVMLWDSLSGMNPIAAAATAAEITTGDESEVTNAEIDSETGVVTLTDDGDITVTVTFTNNGVDYSFTKDVKIATFSAVADADGDSTVVDISSLTTDDAITGYQVTTATADGVQVAQTEVALADVTDGTITADTTGADKVEVAPIYEGVMNTEYLIPSDTYNITVTANNGARTDVYANDQMIINNLNQGGDNWTIARTIAASTDYEVEDVVIAEGSVTFNYQDDKSSESTVTAVKFVKAPSIVTRATRVYVIGDSLVAKYYGTAPEGSEGLVRTGWGDVLQNYISGARVTNLGNSGAWADGMRGDAFTNVLASAQAGDIFILESGYNDSSHTSMDVMRDAIEYMVEEAQKIGMTVFVVTPNSSSHSVSEYVGSVKSTSDVIVAAENSGANLIDLAAKSADYYRSYYGDATYDSTLTLAKASIPSETDTILKAYYNNSGDSLHSSYNAASCWAAIIANGLLNNEATADIVNTEYEYEFSDGTNTITVSAEQITNPNYTANDITFDSEAVTVTRPTGKAITAAGEGETIKVVLTDNTATLTAEGVELSTGDGYYYFTMPNNAVTLTVTAQSSDEDGDSNTGDGDSSSESDGTN
ncbi:MAG: hypothetical protein LUF26_02465 [Firmicutes bacterium]|nr:hypothetical protein [Bacillota bacterium]